MTCAISGEENGFSLFEDRFSFDSCIVDALVYAYVEPEFGWFNEVLVGILIENWLAELTLGITLFAI